MRVVRKPGPERQALEATIKALDKQQARIGWFASAKYEGGQPVAGIAAVHEFGSPERQIPPRLGMRTVASEKKEAWKETSAKVARAAAAGKIAPDKVLEVVAMTAAGNVAEHIAKVTEPPLKDSTIAARKRKLADKGKSLKGGKGGAGVAGIEKPLVASGILLNTLSYEVNGKETRVRGGA